MQWLASGWFWTALGVALLALEALVPGAFMLWFGLAALATAVLVAVLPIPLPMQWIVFGVLAVAALAAAHAWRKRNPPAASDRPMLNQRTQRFIGAVYPLEMPITNGRGRIKVDDTFWTVQGEDAPAGTPIRVLGVDGMVLLVTIAHPAHVSLAESQ
jgi:inner membrane protein